MILVDTSVWVDHLRVGDAGLEGCLRGGRVLMHPFVIGEIALGHLRQRTLILGDLAALPQISIATDAEVLDFVDRHGLAGLGIGWVDAHLLASVRLAAGARLWTRDKRLNGVATRMQVAFPLRQTG